MQRQIPQSFHKKIMPILKDKKLNKIIEKTSQTIQKIQIYYKYRIGILYRQLKKSIYQNLLKQTQKIKNHNNFNNNKQISIDQQIQILYKFLNLNSKYHHRQKMRFSRTPLFKYIKYNFQNLQQKQKQKSYKQLYQDLQDDYDDDNQPDKKQHQKIQHFNKLALSNYKKKNNILGNNIIIAHGYDDLKQRLINQYNWVENKDKQSLFYNFKFMSKKKDIDYVNLLDDQIINHFEQNKNITAKFGLCRNIRNIISIGGNPHKYFPRCYDVNDVAELEDFYQNFKFSQIQRIILDYVNKGGEVDKRRENIIQLCLKIIQQKLLITFPQKLQLINQNKQIYITQQQWQEICIYFLTKKEQTNTNLQLLKHCQQILKNLQSTDLQYHLNQQNIWIVKPASMSRGRGIKTFNNLQEIFDYIAGKQISWVIQKYIERPLIVKKRKFDIRQWVLLTDFQPLRVWVYQECYIRFCAQIYSTQNLKNRKAHLTNNSVTKGISNVPQYDGIDQNMMTQSQFSTYLQEIQEKEIFQKIIKPQIITISIETLKSVKQNIVSRKNTLQLFGYDFMIDQNYRVWLIEVNSSPTMEYSTKITQKLVKKGMNDLADLIQNYMMNGKIYKQNGKYGNWKLVCGY